MQFPCLCTFYKFLRIVYDMFLCLLKQI